jgi:hypothetical protein
LITELRDDKVKDDITVNERLQVIDEQLASMSANQEVNKLGNLPQML